MRCLHVATFSGRSGIARYASDFFDLVLSPRGYEKLDLDGIDGAELIQADDTVHIEIGVNQFREIDLLYRLIARGHTKIDVTLHDPPFVRWPHFKFPSRTLSNVAKFVQLYLGNLGIGVADLRRVRRFFVLTRKGTECVRQRYGFENVYHCPHIVRPDEIRDAKVAPLNLFHFGFVARNKGLDYALALHRDLLERHPDTRFIVVGNAISRESAMYLAGLQSRFFHNVEYKGFVPEAELESTFDNGSLVILPLAEYRSVIPASGSILGAMKLGKLVVATDVNAVSETITDGRTGYFLKRKLKEDVNMLAEILDSPEQICRVARAATANLRSRHDPDTVGQSFDRAGRH
jgi:glycosyltransferase involved in cell wall biosynthesis